MKTFLASVTLLMASAGLAGAADSPPFESFQDKAPDSKRFPEIQTEARRLNLLMRDAIIAPTRQSITDALPVNRVHAFGPLVKERAGQVLDRATYPQLPAQLTFFETTLNAWNKLGDRLPAFTVDRNFTRDAVLYAFNGNDNAQGTFAVQPYTSDPREDTLVELAAAIYPYQRNANAYVAYKAGNQLEDLADEWDAFFEKGRPQSFFDVSATTLFEYRHFKTDHLVGPPDRQWFAGHLNAVVENVRAAPKGDELGGAVAIEWIGVNWWKLKVPFGISLSSLYSDRPGVSHVGHGVTIYLANRYCIGWASHGGDNGFYASIDAVKFIETKKSQIDSYRTQVTKIFGK